MALAADLEAQALETVVEVGPLPAIEAVVAIALRQVLDLATEHPRLAPVERAVTLAALDAEADLPYPLTDVVRATAIVVIVAALVVGAATIVGTVGLGHGRCGCRERGHGGDREQNLFHGAISFVDAVTITTLRWRLPHPA